jgi:hypothetical protein
MATSTLALSRGFVGRAGRQDRGVIMLGQLLIGAVDSGLITTDRSDAGLEVIANHSCGTLPIAL